MQSIRHVLVIEDPKSKQTVYLEDDKIFHWSSFK